MKNLLIVLLALAAGYGYYDKAYRAPRAAAAAETSEAEALAARNARLAAAAQPPAPTPPPAPAAPAESEPRLAPEGVFYLTQYVSLMTKTGVIGFEPGQQVRFVRGQKTTLVVTDGKYQVEVTPDNLTNDLDLAAIARRHDQAAQAALAARNSADLAAYEHGRIALNVQSAASQQQAGNHTPPRRSAATPPA